MPSSNLQTITNTVRVVYEYIKDPALPPVQKTIEASAYNTVSTAPQNLVRHLYHPDCMCFCLPECRYIESASHNIKILSFSPQVVNGEQGLYLQAIQQFVIIYYSYQQDKWLQSEFSQLVYPFISLPESISPSQVRSITASTINTQITSLTPCQINVISDIQYTISYTS